MTPLRPAPISPFENMLARQALLNQPCEFFRDFFGGRVPTLAEKVDWIERSMQQATPVQVWENELYFVRVFQHAPFIHLEITAKDEQRSKDWRHFQLIKNQIVGPECEAVELFPAAERSVEASRQHHLWVVADPHFRFPFGFHNRFVLAEPIRLERNGEGALRASVTDLVPTDAA